MTNPTGDKVSVKEWSNSQDYMMKLSRLEDNYLEAADREDVQDMILKLRNLLSVLKRVRKSSKNRNLKIFDPEHKKYWENRMIQARDLYQSSFNAEMGSHLVRKHNNVKRNQALETLRLLYEDIGDFMMDGGLTFQEDTEPWNEFFEG